MTVMSIETAGHTSLQLDMPPALPLNRVSIQSCSTSTPTARSIIPHRTLSLSLHLYSPPARPVTVVLQLLGDLPKELGCADLT